MKIEPLQVYKETLKRLLATITNRLRVAAARFSHELLQIDLAGNVPHLRQEAGVMSWNDGRTPDTCEGPDPVSTIRNEAI